MASSAKATQKEPAHDEGHLGNEVLTIRNDFHAKKSVFIHIFFVENKTRNGKIASHDCRE